MKLYIKNMVSIRCKMIVQQELSNLNIIPRSLELGEVELDYTLSPELKTQFANALQNWGLQLIDDRKTIFIERIKGAIIEMIYNREKLPETNYSIYLADKLKYDYTYLSNTFSEITGVTVEQYIIMHKIERAKNLMVEEELSVNEIANKLSYSSSAHLSNQFKKITGLTPSFFKQVRLRAR